MNDHDFWCAVALRCVGKSPNNPRGIADYADELVRLRQERYAPVKSEAEPAAPQELPLEDYGDIDDQVKFLHSQDEAPEDE